MTEEQNIQDILAEVAERAEETRDQATKIAIDWFNQHLKK